MNQLVAVRGLPALVRVRGEFFTRDFPGSMLVIAKDLTSADLLLLQPPRQNLRSVTMVKKAFTEIMAGVGDAIAYAKGDKSKGVAHAVAVPDQIDVRAIRALFKLSRPKFAAGFGLEMRAIQDWEQHRRRPDRASRILLRVIAKEPEAVDRALAAE